MRKRTARRLGLLLLLVTFVVGGPEVPSLPADPTSRPNVVVIMTDDQTLESLRIMPKTLALVGTRGTTFSNAFVSYPLCCPSRATFLTGQYSHNHGVASNKMPAGGYRKLDHANTLAAWLQEAGYHTIHVGKYLNEYGLENPTEVPPGWSDWQGLVDPATYQTRWRGARQGDASGAGQCRVSAPASGAATGRGRCG
jgi:arylsulfatase A-like enzyme